MTEWFFGLVGLGVILWLIVRRQDNELTVPLIIVVCFLAVECGSQ